MRTPGYGDPDTWGPCYGHPNDPRSEPADYCQCARPEPDGLGVCRECMGEIVPALEPDPYWEDS